MSNKVGRPRKAESYRRLVVAALAEDPKVPTRDLLERATAEGYDGGKSAFYALVATTREPTRTPQRRSALPGESSRHDLIDVTVPYSSGMRRRTRLFVTRLDYSRFVAISVLPDDGPSSSVEAIARALVDHFGRVGGVPLLATFDGRKFASAAAGPLAYLALDLGLGIELLEPTRTRSSSSRIVRTIKLELPLHQLHDENELARRLETFTAERNARVSEETGRTPLSMLVEERRRLRPLKISLADLTLRFPVVVQPGGIVVFEGREYAMSPLASGVSGTLFLGAHQIKIVVGEFSRTFARWFPRAVRDTG